MLEQIKSTVNLIRKQYSGIPKWGIILGSGLGKLAHEVEVELKISYQDIPGFPKSTVMGHAGNMIFGKINGIDVLVFQGRFHYYEGYSMDQVALPVRLMHALGIDKLVVSNASGGVNPNFEIGDLMLISDHISLLLPTNPLIGPNDDKTGPRFPDMSEAYSKDLIHKAKNIAKGLNITLQEGVYVGVTGPTFETPAEYKMIKAIGGDAVGMSTVPEVMVANHAGMEVFGLSVITDLGVEGKIVKVTHEDVFRAADLAAEKMTSIVKQLIAVH